MKLYVFSSSTMTNIWAGVGARLWAVAQPTESARGRARNLPVGAFGLLYCVEKSSLTVPFVVRSRPSEEIVYDVWPESEGWHLPFQIIPLGTPRRLLSKNGLQSLLPGLQSSGQPWSAYFHIQAVTVFSPSVIEDEDWEVLLERLGDP